MKKKMKFILTCLLAVVLVLAGTLLLVPKERDATLADLSYTVTDGELTITDCRASASGKLVIPSSIQGYPITSIGSGAFSYCTKLTSVTISSGITSIGDFAFNGCTKLTSVTIPDSVTSIGKGAFIDCKGLTEITIPNSIASIDEYMFHNCGGLTSVIIGSGVTCIDSSAFENCPELKDIYYTGTEEQWRKIPLSGHQETLINATKHYSYTPR